MRRSSLLLPWLLLCFATLAHARQPDPLRAKFAGREGTPTRYLQLRAPFVELGLDEKFRQLLERMSWPERERLLRGETTPAQLLARLDAAPPVEDAAVAARPLDVVVVGAGMAGIIVARELLAAGKRVVVLEATDHIGGRTLTDPSGFGFPVDLGAMWLHDAPKNVLAPIAVRMGFTLVKDDKPQLWGFDGKELSQELGKRFIAAGDRIDAELDKVGAKRDTSGADGVPLRGPLEVIAARWIANLESGVAFAELSTTEFGGQADEVHDVFVKDGLGRLTQALAYGVPVKLGQRVRSVTWGKDGVVIKTDRDEHRARRVVITVSAGALHAGQLTFSPELPPWKKSAIEHVKMGHFCKIVLGYEKRPLPEVPANSRIYDISDAEHPLELIVRPMDEDLIIAMAGDDFATDVERSGDAGATALVVRHLTAMYKDKLPAPRRGIVTRFNTTEETLGAWSAVDPGHASERKAFARPIDDRVYFAGEAAGGSEWVAYLNGAYLSGKATAKQLLARMAREKKTR